MPLRPSARLSYLPTSGDLPDVCLQIPATTVCLRNIDSHSLAVVWYQLTHVSVFLIRRAILFWNSSTRNPNRTIYTMCWCTPWTGDGNGKQLGNAQLGTHVAGMPLSWSSPSTQKRICGVQDRRGHWSQWNLSVEQQVRAMHPNVDGKPESVLCTDTRSESLCFCVISGSRSIV